MNLAATMSLANSGFLGPLAAAQGALGKFKGLLSGVGGQLIALAGVGSAAGLAFKTLKEAANMETFQTVFAVLLGSATAAKNRLKELADFAAATPFELPELATATKKLLAFGIADEQVMGTLRQLGDVAASIDAPIGDIAEIYGKARVQGRLFAEDINQLTGRGIPIIQELAKQFGVAESEVKSLVEGGKVGFPAIQKAFADLTGAGSKFGGMMEKRSGTWDGLISSLKDNVNALFREFGAPLIDALRPMLSDAVNMAGSLATTARAWGEEVGAAITTMRNLFETGTLWEAAGLQLKIVFTDAAASLVQKIAVGFETLRPVVSNLFDVFRLQMSAISSQFAAGIRLVLADALPDMPGFRGTSERLRGLADADIYDANWFKQAASAAMGSMSVGGGGDFVKGLTTEAGTMRSRLAELIQAALPEALQPALGGAAAPAEAAAAAAAAASGKTKTPEGDRLAKIGGFIGQGGPANDYARKTALGIEKLVSHFLSQSRGRPIENNMPWPGVVWG